MLNIDYVLLNNTESLRAVESFSTRGSNLPAPGKVYVIQDQVIPPNSPEVSAQQRSLADFASKQGTQYMYGAAMASHYLTQEVVAAGYVVAANDQDIIMVGAVGALGLKLDAEQMADVLENRTLQIRGGNYLYVDIEGALSDDLDMRDAGMELAELLQGRANSDTVVCLQLKGAELSLREKMLLCGWCQRAGVRAALFANKQKAAALRMDLSRVKARFAVGGKSVTTAPDTGVTAVYIGGSHGGFLEDIKLAAELLEGKQVARRVRLSVAPASSEVYYQAATAGYLTTIMRAGGLVLNQCALPPVQALIGKNEVMVSNDIHNEENYAGEGGHIILTDTRKAVEAALSGCLGNPPVAEKEEAALSFTGRVWKFGDDVDTDIIIPTQHLSYASKEKIRKHVFEPLRPELSELLAPGDIIVSGENFGCGSSREQAAEILVYVGIRAVVAKSFARIFFRNAINNGLLLIECPELPDKVDEGDEITVHINKCVEHKGKEYPLSYLPDNLYRLIVAGGLVKSTQKQNGLL